MRRLKDLWRDPWATIVILQLRIDSVTTAVGCSYGLAYNIKHDLLIFWKVSLLCVPWHTHELNGTVPAASLSVWKRTKKTCSTEFFMWADNRVITINLNESVLQCIGNILLLLPGNLRLNHRHILRFLRSAFNHFQRKGDNGNAEFYGEALLMIWNAIRRKLPGLLTRRDLLHHENARPKWILINPGENWPTFATFFLN